MSPLTGKRLGGPCPPLPPHCRGLGAGTIRGCPSTPWLATRPVAMKCHSGGGWHPLAGAGSPLPEAMTSSPNPATRRCLHWSPAKLRHALSCPFPPSGPVASASRSSCPDSLSTLRKQLTLFLPRLLQQLGEPPPTPFSATRLLEPRLLLSLHQTSSSQTRGEGSFSSPDTPPHTVHKARPPGDKAVLFKQVLSGSAPPQPRLGSGSLLGARRASAWRDIRTEAEELEDPVHGELDVGGVVFQAQNEELFFIEDGEPVQEIHSVQPDLQPHLGPKKKAGVSPGVALPAPQALFQTCCTRLVSQQAESLSKQSPSEGGF